MKQSQRLGCANGGALVGMLSPVAVRSIADTVTFRDRYVVSRRSVNRSASMSLIMIFSLSSRALGSRASRPEVSY
jgi:hypothetical protein